MVCGLPAPECLIEHIARSVPNASPSKEPDSVRADCPLCGHHGCITITAGDKRRFVITCHAGCADTQVRLALLNRHHVSDACLPPVRGRIKERAPRVAKRTDAQIIAELTKLLGEPVNGNAYRLRAAMLLLDLSAEDAAERLGIPERTRRRLLCP